MQRAGRTDAIEDLGQITTASGAAAASIAYAVGPDGLVVGYGATDSGALGAVWTGFDAAPGRGADGLRRRAAPVALNGFRQAVGDATDSAENRQIAVIVDLRRVPKSIPALFDLNTLVTNGAGWTIRSGSGRQRLLGDRRHGPLRTGPSAPSCSAPAPSPCPSSGRVPAPARSRGRPRSPVGRRCVGALRAGDEADPPRAPRRRLAIRPLAGCVHRHEADLHARRRRRSRGARGLRPGTDSRAAARRSPPRPPSAEPNEPPPAAVRVFGLQSTGACGAQPESTGAARGGFHRDGTPRDETPVTGRRQRSVQRRLWTIGRARPLRSVECDDRGERALSGPTAVDLLVRRVLPERRPASRGRGRSDRAHLVAPG